jgi:hypothetical protein
MSAPQIVCHSAARRWSVSISTDSEDGCLWMVQTPKDRWLCLLNGIGNHSHYRGCGEVGRGLRAFQATAHVMEIRLVGALVDLGG